MRTHLYLIALFLVLALFTNTSLHAQSASSPGEGIAGSVYSSVGVGLPIDNTSSSLLAQGLLGITNVTRETSSIANPALWAHTFFTRAGTGFQFVRSDVDNGTSTTTNLNLQPGYLHMLFPIKPGRVGLSLGMYPVTRTSFQSENTRSFLVGDDFTVDYTNEIQSKGGINKIEAGVGVKLTNNFSIGYAPSIAFLSINKTENISFNWGGLESFNSENYINGVTFAQRFGLTGTFNSVLNETDRISIGATLNLPYTIKADQELTSRKFVEGSYQQIDVSDQLPATKGDISMPLEIGVGLGYAPNVLVNIAAEGQLQNWGDYSDDFGLTNQATMVNRVKMGLGGQYHPYRRGLDTFLSRFKYSAGVSYDSGHLSINNQDISTLWLNTGIGIRSLSGSFVDISIQYGLRGTTSNNLFKERIWAVGFSVNLAEAMFIRPKLR